MLDTFAGRSLASLPGTGYLSHRMSAVSNFLLRRNDGLDLTIRPARRHEFEAAVRLILAGLGGLDDEAGVIDFLQTALSRGLDLTAIWVAVEPKAERIQWAVLPMPLAGRAMLLLVPTRLRPGMQARHVSELIAGSLLEAQQRRRHAGTNSA